VHKQWLTPLGVDGIPFAMAVRDGKLIWRGHPNGLEEALIEAMAKPDYSPEKAPLTKEQRRRALLPKMREISDAAMRGEGFGITDILRTQRSVERMPLTKEEAEKTYDCWQQGDTYREYNPEGHWFTSFPDGTKFVPNSVYYLYAIPEKETNANPNL
jgi:hypothetical protein